MRVQIGSRIPKFLPEIIARHYCSEDGVLATEHRCGRRQIAFLHRSADGRTANNRAIHFHRWNANDIEMKLRTQFFEKSEIAAPIFSKRPFVSDANFAQRLRIDGQLLDKTLRRSVGEFPIKVDNEEVLDTQIADQRDFVPGGSEQMR